MLCEDIPETSTLLTSPSLSSGNADWGNCAQDDHGDCQEAKKYIKDNGSSPWRGSPEPFYPPLPLPDPASEGRRRRRSLPRTSNLLSLLGSHPFLILRIRIRIPSLFPSPPPHSLPLRAITLSHILACHFLPHSETKDRT